ncbi:MAG TPA: hypothetical protein DEF61_04120, partial [Firmicutes bacterium]|nr:hypothetical protein [Bacillota bacterium]
MQKKMIRFLNSIGLSEDIELFDMDFSFVSMNPYDKKQVDMAIEKRTPWNYELLDKFISALNNVS